jgi:exonuclease III
VGFLQDIQDTDKLRICTYNIRNSSNSQMTFALKAMKTMGINLGILTEDKLIDNTYTTNAHGYVVVATQAKSHHQGGVALFYNKTTSLFTLKGTTSFGPNVICTTLVSGKRRWILVGVYIPPSETNRSTINYLQLVLQHDTNHDTILMGDLNVNFNKMANSNTRQDDTAALVSVTGLQDLSQHFQIKDNI